MAKLKKNNIYDIRLVGFEMFNWEHLDCCHHWREAGGFNFLVFGSKELKMLRRSLSKLQCYRDEIENKVSTWNFKIQSF